MKVLLVGEEGIVRRRIADALAETPGVRVTLSSPAEDEVRSCVDRELPDVVIVNVHMPSGGALEMIRELKSLDRPPVVIALSSTRSFTYRTLCQQAGAEYYFDVVHEPEWLTQAVRELEEHLTC